MTFSATVSPLTGFHEVDWVLVKSVLPSPMASDLEATLLSNGKPQLIMYLTRMRSSFH